jgi:hypothetical protein
LKKLLGLLENYHFRYSWFTYLLSTFITVLKLREYAGFTTVFLSLAVTIPLSWFVLKLDENVPQKRLLQIFSKLSGPLAFSGALEGILTRGSAKPSLWFS